MALLICPDCGGKVSIRAEFCPHCGCPISDIIDTKFMFKELKDYVLAGVRANLGSSEQMFALAYNFYFGNSAVSISQNVEKARSWLLQASAFESPFADEYLKKWYELRADKTGTPDEWVKRGLDCERGVGTSKDVVMATYYYTLAARAKHPVGLNNLACCLLNGIGIEQNPEKAWKLLLEASDLGNDRASLNLAICFLNGWGTEKNLSEARRFAERAANRKFHDAIRFLEEHFPQPERQPKIVKLPPVKKEDNDIFDVLDEKIKWRTHFERLNQCDYYDAFCDLVHEAFSIYELGEEDIESGYHCILGEFKNIADGDVFYCYPNILDEFSYNKWMISGNDFEC